MLEEEGHFNIDWPDLDEHSVVWEIGGYEGRWALAMAEKYNPQLHVFEPQDWAADNARRKLAGYNAQVYQFALWTYSGEMQIHNYGRDGASLVNFSVKDLHEIRTVDIYPFFVGVPPKDPVLRVDLCQMNIEGGEFILLPYMIGMGLVSYIKRLRCQWHPNLVPSGQGKWDRLKKMMDKTHELYFDYGNIAQEWKLRE